MSDFIYSKELIKMGNLKKEIQAVYHQNSPLVDEFHGEWGSLAVSRNLYNGFQPIETTEHICIVVGGPVLCFQDNRFLTQNSNVAGTEAIYNRWLNGIIQWDQDLSGPFVVLIIYKNKSEVLCVTDLMSFIPVFIYKDSTNIMLSTHIDALARTCNQQEKIDKVSKVDFILHGVVTFPYTDYTQIKQIGPAAEHNLKSGLDQLKSVSYWVPREVSHYNTLKEASHDLRAALQTYINRVAIGMPHIAQFISGGEDSRLLSALLPKECRRDAFVFLENMNIEGEVAQKAAKAYGAKFHLATRSKAHYIEILPSCADLVGSGSQYANVHTFGFHKSCKLEDYPAVFGGLFSDALFKGTRIKKLGGQGIFPFLPQIKKKGYSVVNKVSNVVFTNEVLSELSSRREEHLEYVSSFRTESAEEWFELWPISMNSSIANLHGNRRLFRSYEPFMANEVVKLSAAVPQNWKLNRKLFFNTAKPLLKPTKWLMNSDGRWPYFPWYINCFPQFIMWLYQQTGRRTGLIKRNQGSWADWNLVMSSFEWKQAINEYSDGISVIKSVFNVEDLKDIFNNRNLNKKQRMNLMQVLYYFH